MEIKPAPSEVDVLIVGAGISGVAQAVYLQRECPGTTFIASASCLDTLANPFFFLCEPFVEPGILARFGD